MTQKRLVPKALNMMFGKKVKDIAHSVDIDVCFFLFGGTFSK